MKFKQNIIIFGIILMLLSVTVMAETENSKGSSQSSGMPETTNAPDDAGSDNIQSGSENAQGEVKQVTTTTMTQKRAQSVSELKEMIQKRQQEMTQEQSGMKGGQSKAYQNQNQVRTAVHALKSMGDLVGNKGEQISQIAQEFDNSIQATLNAEEKIQSKSGFSKFLFGGDKESAEKIETESNKNQEKIQELKQIHAECDCDEEVKQMLQEQIQSMEQEQSRLKELAQEEKNKKGLFGWLKK